MKTRSLIAAALALAALLLAACSAPTPAPEPTPEPAPEAAPGAAPEAGLDGTSWTLTEIGGAAPVAGSPATLEFLADGGVAGTTGCNRYFGGFTADAASLSFGQMGSTKMACEPALMDQENRYLEIIGRAASYTLAADTLTITADDGTTLVFERAA
jgi:heat shock protein HslJ